MLLNLLLISDKKIDAMAFIFLGTPGLTDATAPDPPAKSKVWHGLRGCR